MKGEVSDWLTVTSYVPRGSLLRPLFFIVYINTLSGIISKDSSIALYAETVKCTGLLNFRKICPLFKMT